MAVTKLGLINNALILIGDLPLAALSGTTRAHVVSSNLYDSTVKSELSKHKWGFARKVAELVLDVEGVPSVTVDPTGDEWSARYALPANLLQLIKVDPSIPYQIIENKVFTNYDNTLYCDYIADVAESLFPWYFAKMIEYRLAMDFAPALRDSATSMQLMAQQYENASRMARFTDSQQHPITPIQDRPFIDARR
ncbi:MAG: hypothetical protein NZ730_06695 [Porticoccaceae bacterium]|nr:hypothetical protein [Porticoccaceae bacterium]